MRQSQLFEGPRPDRSASGLACDERNPRSVGPRRIFNLTQHMRRIVQSLMAGPVVILIPIYGFYFRRVLGFMDGRYFDSVFMIGAGYALGCLPASIFLPLGVLRAKPLNGLIGSGLVIGIVAVAYVVWLGGGITLRDQLDVLILWCLGGPAAVAIWNLVLITKGRRGRGAAWACPDFAEPGVKYRTSD